MGTPATSAREELTFESAHERLSRMYGLLNEHDPAHVPTIFAERLEFVDDAWPVTIRDHAEMRRFLTTAWRAFPDLRFEMGDGPYLAGDGFGAAMRMRLSGTMLGPFDPPGFAPTGQRLSIEYGGFYEFEGGRLSRARIIVNMNELAGQLGAAPLPGSRGERFVVALQRLRARRMRGRAGKVDSGGGGSLVNGDRAVLNEAGR